MSTAEKRQKKGAAGRSRGGRPVSKQHPPTPEEIAALADSPELPANWDKWVSAAYLRMRGLSQEKAAKDAGISERTLWDWEKRHPDQWKRAKGEARDRWMNSLVDASRAAVLASVEGGNAELGMRILERVDPELQAPETRLKLSGTGPGGGIVLQVVGPGGAPPALPAGFTAEVPA
jgi:transcriptional regulator with XRE-family HTH domain